MCPVANYKWQVCTGGNPPKKVPHCTIRGRMQYHNRTGPSHKSNCIRSVLCCRLNLERDHGPCQCTGALLCLLYRVGMSQPCLARPPNSCPQGAELLRLRFRGMKPCVSLPPFSCSSPFVSSCFLI